MTTDTGDLVRRLREFEGSDALGNGDFSVCTEAADALEAKDREIAREEQSHSRTIDERDAAEKALSDAYAIVTGRPPEWSNHFGYKDALDEMADALAGTAQETAWQPTHRHYKGGLIRVLHRAAMWHDMLPVIVYESEHGRVQVRLAQNFYQVARKSVA